jgi:hypothetical protein
MAALGGTWLTAVFGFARLSLQSDQIAINPKLPAKWRSLGFGIEWRGRRLNFRIDADHELLQATLEAGDSMTFLVNGRQHEVRCDQAAVLPSLVVPHGLLRSLYLSGGNTAISIEPGGSAPSGRTDNVGNYLVGIVGLHVAVRFLALRQLDLLALGLLVGDMV